MTREMTPEEIADELRSAERIAALYAGYHKRMGSRVVAGSVRSGAREVEVVRGFTDPQVAR